VAFVLVPVIAVLIANSNRQHNYECFAIITQYNYYVAYAKHKMCPIAIDVGWSGCLSVKHNCESYKNELIDTIAIAVVLVGPRNNIGTRSLQGKEKFGGMSRTLQSIH